MNDWMNEWCCEPLIIICDRVILIQQLIVCKTYFSRKFIISRMSLIEVEKPLCTATFGDCIEWTYRVNASNNNSSNSNKDQNEFQVKSIYECSGRNTHTNNNNTNRAFPFRFSSVICSLVFQTILKSNLHLFYCCSLFYGVLSFFIDRCRWIQFCCYYCCYCWM